QRSRVFVGKWSRVNGEWCVAGKRQKKGGKGGTSFGRETLCLAQCFEELVRQGWEKRMLWDYLSVVVNNCEGEVIIMGDFNEVRLQSDRFGLVFHARDVEVFNSFILNAGLAEVSLGGSAYTWWHKSVKKMCKLDRFLISENMWNSYPNISAIILDRYLSD
nr:RNA-directed DNA polymerase, eukaryota [Tanacetum cinerariifolium]